MAAVAVIISLSSTDLFYVLVLIAVRLSIRLK